MATKAVPVLALVLTFVLVIAAHADPKHWKREGWGQTDFSKTSIPFDEIVSGGPPKDGIPSIDNPRFTSVSKVDDLSDVEPVIGLEIDGDARAYPLRILIWHEIVNDVVGRTPVAITYCPLCNSAVVFDRRNTNRVLEFGATGKLRKSDLIMYDRQTHSWWQQFTGEAIIGELLGAELKVIPARLEAFKDFKARHPLGRVLVPNKPGMRRYGSNPYVGYDSASTPFLFRGQLPTEIEPMARVVVVRRDARDPIIVALAHLRRSGTIKRDEVQLSWRSGQASALDSREIARGRDVGTVEVVSTAAETRKTPLAYDVTFAFVAHAFHPDVSIIGSSLRPANTTTD